MRTGPPARCPEYPSDSEAWIPEQQCALAPRRPGSGSWLVTAQALRAESTFGDDPQPVPARGAWQRVRQVRASDEIVRQFRKALFEGRLKAGDPLGSENQLAAQFGVSRTTVRDALRTLEASGIVEIRTGVKGGARIAQGDPNRFADGLAVQLKLVGLDVVDALAAQLGLEWVAAELAALNATQVDLARLEQLLAQSEGLINSAAEFAESSGEFHQAIAEASHNWAIITSLRAIRELLSESHAEQTSPERARRVVSIHRTILEAIQRGESEVAGQLMRRHVGLTRQNMGRLRSSETPA